VVALKYDLMKNARGDCLVEMFCTEGLSKRRASGANRGGGDLVGRLSFDSFLPPLILVRQARLA